MRTQVERLRVRMHGLKVRMRGLKARLDGMKARLALGAVGVAGMAVGVDILLTDRYIHHPLYVVGWLAGAVALHDGLLVPTVLAVGALLHPRGPLRAGLIAAACVTVIALPVLLAPRKSNRTVLPLDYPRGLLVSLAAVALLTGLAWTWTATRGRRRGRKGREQRG